MKKIKYLFMVVIATLCSAMFTACGGDDNDEAKGSNASFYYSFSLSEDVLSIADVKINYIGTDGEEKSETISSTSWEKTFTANNFNVSAGVAISMTLKNNVTLPKESYKIGYTFSYLVQSTKDGTNVGRKVQSVIREKSVSADDVSSTLRKISGSSAFKIDSEGNVSKTSLSWQDNGVYNDLELIPFV